MGISTNCPAFRQAIDAGAGAILAGATSTASVATGSAVLIICLGVDAEVITKESVSWANTSARVAFLPPYALHTTSATMEEVDLKIYARSATINGLRAAFTHAANTRLTTTSSVHALLPRRTRIPADTTVIV